MLRALVILQTPTETELNECVTGQKVSATDRGRISGIGRPYNHYTKEEKYIPSSHHLITIEDIQSRCECLFRFTGMTIVLHQDTHGQIIIVIPGEQFAYGKLLDTLFDDIDGRLVTVNGIPGMRTFAGE